MQIYKLTTLGDSGVGKTKIWERWFPVYATENDKFIYSRTGRTTTPDVAITGGTIDFDGVEVGVQGLDNPGQLEWLKKKMGLYTDDKEYETKIDTSIRESAEEKGVSYLTDKVLQPGRILTRKVIGNPIYQRMNGALVVLDASLGLENLVGPTTQTLLPEILQALMRKNEDMEVYVIGNKNDLPKSVKLNDEIISSLSSILGVDISNYWSISAKNDTDSSMKQVLKEIVLGKR